MRTEEIKKKIQELKQQGKVSSNVFFSFSDYENHIWDTLETPKTLVMTRFLDGANRLYFYTVDIDDLKNVLKTYHKNTVIEIIAKDKHFLQTYLNQAGYKTLSNMCRIANKKLSSTMELSENDLSLECGRYAEKNDAKRIHKLLWETFDTRVAHLPDIKEVMRGIQKKEYYLVEENKQIISLIQSKILPKSYYCNQIINLGDKKIFHKAFRHILSTYGISGGEYAYAWVDETNIASLKFFEKYDFVPDGLWSVVYFKTE